MARIRTNIAPTIGAANAALANEVEKYWDLITAALLDTGTDTTAAYDAMEAAHRARIDAINAETLARHSIKVEERSATAEEKTREDITDVGAEAATQRRYPEATPAENEAYAAQASRAIEAWYGPDIPEQDRYLADILAGFVHLVGLDDFNRSVQSARIHYHAEAIGSVSS